MRMLADFSMAEIQAMLGQKMTELGQALLHRCDGSWMLCTENNVDLPVGHVDLYLQLAELLGM